MSIESLVIPLLREVIYDTYANFPTAGLSVGDLAWATDRKCLYRWSGSAWESIGISSRHGDYANIGDPADYPESSLYQADDQDVLYMVVEGAWESIVTPPQFTSQTDVTGSRAWDTVYQNTQGSPMLVAVAFHRSGVSTMTAYSDSNASPSQVVGIATNASDGYVTLVFLVLPGNYYKITRTGGVSDPDLDLWLETY